MHHVDKYLCRCRNNHKICNRSYYLIQLNKRESVRSIIPSATTPGPNIGFCVFTGEDAESLSVRIFAGVSYC